jgi:hypothetical protein
MVGRRVGKVVGKVGGKVGGKMVSWSFRSLVIWVVLCRCNFGC